MCFRPLDVIKVRRALKFVDGFGSGFNSSFTVFISPSSLVCVAEFPRKMLGSGYIIFIICIVKNVLILFVE